MVRKGDKDNMISDANIRRVFTIPRELYEEAQRLADRLTQEGPGKVYVSDLVVEGLRMVARSYSEGAKGGASVRPANSDYDRRFAQATTDLLTALQEAGHEVRTPVTGAVIVDGVEIPPQRWDYLAAHWDGELDWVLEEIRSLAR